MNRRLVVAALVALLAFSLVGCGGGEEPPAEQPADQAAAPPPAPAAAPGAEGDAVFPDRSVEESVTFEPFPEGDFVPKEIRTRLAKKPKQPMILFFYDEEQKETDDIEAEIDEVVKDNRGAIDLLTYDLGQYTEVNEEGRAVVETDTLAENEKAKQVIQLARELGVSFTPYVVVVDDQGYMIFRWRGFIDADMLGRQVSRTKK